MQARGTGPLILKSSDVYRRRYEFDTVPQRTKLCEKETVSCVLKPWHASIMTMRLQDDMMELCPRIDSLR